MELFNKDIITSKTVDQILEDTTGISNGSSSTSVGGRYVGSLIEGCTLLIGYDENVFKADENGIYLGSTTFATAPFSVSLAGVITATGLVVGTNVGQGTAAKVFTTTPTTPYNVGDIWVGGSATDMKRCITQRLTGAYNAADWDLATKYTDDSGVTTIIGNVVTTGYVNALAVTAGSVAAENITGTVITGKKFQTKTQSNKGIKIHVDDYTTVATSYLSFWDEVGDEVLVYTNKATGDLHIEGGDLRLYAGLFVDSTLTAGANIVPEITNTGDLGTSSYGWKNLYLTGNIVVAGTVDGVDIAAHTHTGGAGGTVAHSSLGSVSADQHHAQSHAHSSHTSIGVSDHHSSTSNNLDITPNYITANRIILTGSATNPGIDGMIRNTTGAGGGIRTYVYTQLYQFDLTAK